MGMKGGVTLLKSGALNSCALFVAISLGMTQFAHAQSVLPPGGDSYDAWKRYVNNYAASRPMKGLGIASQSRSRISNSVQKQTRLSAGRMSLDQPIILPSDNGFASAVQSSPQQIEWFPNRGKRTGIFALGGETSSPSGFNDVSLGKVEIPAATEVFATSASSSRAGRACEPIVEFRYSDKGHIVRHQADPATTYRGVNKFKSAYPTSYVNAYTQPNGVIVKAYRSGKGCNSRVIAEWKWVAPMEIVMRPPRVRNDCTYRRTLDHEMEHVRIYQNTPREYERKIKEVLARSTNPSRDYRTLYNQIMNEMQRRHSALDNSHFAHSLRGFCK